MVENIADKALEATLSTHGGRDIARQLAHIHMVRVWRLEPFSKRIKTPLIKFEKGESPNKKKLLEALTQSGAVMEKYIQYCLENGGAVSNFQRGVVPMVGYFISHEAHHPWGLRQGRRKEIVFIVGLKFGKLRNSALSQSTNSEES